MSLLNLSSRVLLVILDGIAMNAHGRKNAFKNANPTHINQLFAQYPFTTLEASGESVGLAKGIAGNSEVGHINLGSGRAVTQDLVRINEAIQNKTLEKMPKFIELKNIARKNSKRIHLMGLLSDGGVHSHIDHIKEIISLLSEESDLEIFFHAFMDGRDTPTENGILYLNQILKMPKVKVASMQGRSIGMDRDQRYEKIELCYKTFVGLGNIEEVDPAQYLQNQYKNKITDEFITPVLFHRNFAIKGADSVFFINFRPDRARQITLCMTDPNFSFFPVAIRPVYYLCMSPYVDDEVKLPILFDKEKVRGGLSEILASRGLKQFKVAETEKYAHVTYFFNGGEEKAFKGETRKLIPSPREVKTYDLKPEMSAPKVLEELLRALDDPQYSFYLVNFANLDMVGHTGNYEAAKKAVSVIDDCVAQLMKKCKETKTVMLLTADHGNCDEMLLESGAPHTSHTTNPVPFSLFSEGDFEVNKQIAKPALRDVASTVLSILGIEIPKDFEGKSVFVKRGDV